jgi:hypothetical protein
VLASGPVVEASGPHGVVRIARWACALTATPAFVYIWLGIVQLNHLAEGRVAVGNEVGPRAILGVSEALHDFTLLTIVLCAFVSLTIGLFALFVGRAGDRTRIGMIAISLAVVTVALLVIAADGSTLVLGNVIEPAGQIDEEEAKRFSAALVAGWFPVLHYVTVAALLFGSAAAVITLAHSDSREYFRRHRQSAADPRIWSVSQVRESRDERESDRDP